MLYSVNLLIKSKDVDGRDKPGHDEQCLKPILIPLQS